MKTAKIYCSKKELGSLVPEASLIESYEAFQLVELTPAALKKVAAKIPVEDVTGLYKLAMAGKAVDTSKARYSAKGKMLVHAAYKTAAKLSSGKHHYLVQFHGPVKQTWLRGVKKAGGDFRGHYADFTSIFRLTDAALKKVQALPFVRWIGHLSNESRVAQDVLKAPSRSKKASSLDQGVTGTYPGRHKTSSRIHDTLVIQFFDAKDMKAALPGIKRAGATLLSAEKSGLAVVNVPEAAVARKKTVQALSALHGVRLISTFVVPASCNNVATKILGTAKALATPTAAQPNRLGLTGAGEIIAVADTGLDTGNPQTVMADFAGRITAIHSWPISPSFNPFITNPGADDGAADLDSGHGTHVTGSVLGGGSSAGPAIRGLSHGANLVFQAVEQRLALTPLGRQQLGNDPFQLAGLPNDITRLFDQAYQAGARIHSDSWGSDDAGDYAASSRQLDQFVWKYQDLCIVVAAGNSGTDANRDGVVDEGSVGSPGTAKNCITVGASQSLRNFPNATWGAFLPRDFPALPLSTEKVAADKNKMAAFSGRGPTLDGRIKPDVVAPGSYILSTRSTQITGNGWGAYSNGHYMYEGGTSMATPLVAGALGLLREYLRTKRGVASPSAALLKASLICGAVRLPLPYVTAGALADNHQGFGRVNIDNIVSPAGGAQFGFQDAAAGLSTGAVRTVAVTAVAGRKLRVVLAYSDYPGRGLKNNLNLVLISPNGTRHVGNATGGQLTFDTRNNVEIVEVATPTAGAWRVQVIASNVPQGPQRYALVWLA